MATNILASHSLLLLEQSRSKRTHLTIWMELNTNQTRALFLHFFDALFRICRAPLLSFHSPPSSPLSSTSYSYPKPSPQTKLKVPLTYQTQSKKETKAIGCLLSTRQRPSGNRAQSTPQTTSANTNRMRPTTTMTTQPHYSDTTLSSSAHPPILTASLTGSWPSRAPPCSSLGMVCYLIASSRVWRKGHCSLVHSADTSFFANGDWHSVHHGTGILQVEICRIALRGQLSELLLHRLYGDESVGRWKFHYDSEAGK